MVETNADLETQNPGWEMARVATRTGVVSRHIAGEKETSLDLALCAVRILFARHCNLASQIDGIIFCTQTPDYVMPPNACLLHQALNLPDSVFAMDTNLACSGYLYSLALAEGLIGTGVCSNILLVTSDTYSKLISKGDRSARSLFGDAAAVSWIGASHCKSGLLDVICETAGSGYDKFYIRDGGHRNPLTEESFLETEDPSGNTKAARNINMDGLGVLTFVNSKVPDQIKRLLGRAQIDKDECDLYIFHQASKLALDALTRALQLKPDKVYRNLESIGNTVSASIPIALSAALEEGKVASGGLVLLSGFGVGLSWASALVRIGQPQ
jgi:3-oxoacyl-[acyl-carrier-protein] synthase-3